MDRGGIERLIGTGEISGGMIVKARAAVETATQWGAGGNCVGSGRGGMEASCDGEASGTHMCLDDGGVRWGGGEISLARLHRLGRKRTRRAGGVLLSPFPILPAF